MDIKDKQNQWISVYDACPPNYQKVFVCTEDKYYCVAWFVGCENGDYDWISNDPAFMNDHDDVEYWMPIPELPKTPEQ